MRIIIVDDEPLARQALKLELDKIPLVEVVAECANGYEALDAVQQYKPDLMCLDIQMPGLNGFEVLELLGQEAPPTIFVTAYDTFAVKAFEARALDYLLKPINADRLQQALARFGDSNLPRQKELINDYLNYTAPMQRILLRSGTQVRIIPVEKISHFTAQDDFVEIHTPNTSYLKYERLGKLEELLDNTVFVRIHRSHIINLQFLHKMETTSSGSRLAMLTTDVTIPVSKSGYKKVLEVL